MSDLELFPAINPNLDEVAEESVESDQNIKVVIEDKKILKQKDIFDMKYNKEKKEPKEVVSRTGRVKETKVDEFNDQDKETQRVQEVKNAARNSTSSKYKHLEAARAKGILTRKEKAAKRREEKAEAKRLKDIEKQKRREATKERNRVKARERYRRIKAEKEEKKKSDPIDIPQRKPQYIPRNDSNMSFKQFSSYMMRYEEMKDKYKTYKNRKQINNKEKEKNTKILQQKPKKEFPDNYPLSHLYGVNRFKPTNFNDF